MTEEVYAFNKTQAERSVLAKQMHYKKNGAGTAKLGNKPISNKEIASKHGPCYKYDFNRFLSFSEFKNMPKDLQVEYINKLEDKYDIGIKHISIILFNIGEEGLRSHLRINNILKDCNPDKKRGKTGEQKFKDDIAEQKRRQKVGEEIIPVFNEDPATVEAVPDSRIPMFMDYDGFKKLADKDKIDFCNKILKEYPGTGLSTISVICFEKSKSALTYHMKAYGMLDKVNAPKCGCANFETTESIERLKRDVQHWKNFGTLIYEPRKVEPNIPVASVKTIQELTEEAEKQQAKKPTKTAAKTKTPTKKVKKETAKETAKKEEEKLMADQTQAAQETVTQTQPAHTIDIRDFVEQEVKKAVANLPTGEDTKYSPKDERIGMSFHSEYVSENGLNEAEIDALKQLCKDKNVRVIIDISAW